MTTVILVIHIMIAAALVGVVLVQRSEGGALGIGGGGGGLITARGAANLLTRLTAVLAGAFFVTSIVLALMAGNGNKPARVIAPDQKGTTAPATPGEGGLPKLDPKAQLPSGPQLPQSK